jgi:hypothetical protein
LIPRKGSKIIKNVKTHTLPSSPINAIITINNLIV